MTAARRLAAILAADVVGYSRLMGEDEAGTALGVREHREAARPIVTGLGGRIVKTTGDGLLLEFPSVVAAVECAIAIQKLMDERNAGTSENKRIVYRIGVNLGDVLVEGDDILGRRGQYCGTAGGHLRAGRRADFGRGLRPSARPDRRGLRRFRRQGPQEHRAAGAGLCAQDRLAGASARALRRRAEQGRRRRASRWSSCPSPISAATRSRNISSTASRRA